MDEKRLPGLRALAVKPPADPSTLHGVDLVRYLLRRPSWAFEHTARKLIGMMAKRSKE